MFAAPATFTANRREFTEEVAILARAKPGINGYICGDRGGAERADFHSLNRGRYCGPARGLVGSDEPRLPRGSAKRRQDEPNTPSYVQ